MISHFTSRVREMKKVIINIFFLTCIIFTLQACTQSTWLYRVNVQQGNVITADMVQKLHVGMPKEQVYDIMGSPLLVNTFNDNRWAYVYTFKPSRGPYVQKHLIIYFRNDRIIRMDSSNIKD